MSKSRHLWYERKRAEEKVQTYTCVLMAVGLAMTFARQVLTCLSGQFITEIYIQYFTGILHSTVLLLLHSSLWITLILLDGFVLDALCSSFSSSFHVSSTG